MSNINKLLKLANKFEAVLAQQARQETPIYDSTKFWKPKDPKANLLDLSTKIANSLHNLNFGSVQVSQREGQLRIHASGHTGKKLLAKIDDYISKNYPDLLPMTIWNSNRVGTDYRGARFITR